MTSACVILVINKAWHSPFACSKVPGKKKKKEKEKVYQRLERPFTERELSGQLCETCNTLPKMPSALREPLLTAAAAAEQILS